MSSNSDLLAAESLLLTLITFLYSQAYPEISASAAIRLGSRVRGDPDVAQDRRRIWATRKRVLALAGAALVVGLVFLPPAAALA